MQITLVVIFFLGFFIITIYSQIKNRIISDATLFIFRIIREVGMLILLIMVFIYANTWIVKIDTLESIINFENFFLIVFCLTLLTEVISGFYMMVKSIVELIKERKKVKRDNRIFESKILIFQLFFQKFEKMIVEMKIFYLKLKKRKKNQNCKIGIQIEKREFKKISIN